MSQPNIVHNKLEIDPILLEDDSVNDTVMSQEELCDTIAKNTNVALEDVQKVVGNFVSYYLTKFKL